MTMRSTGDLFIASRAIGRSRIGCYALAALIAAAPALESLPASAQAVAPAPPASAYRESIPGTLVSFEMVPVPGGTVTLNGKTIVVEPFYFERTEATWDMYDVFMLRLDGAQDRAGADAIARPSQPYGAPDYGWGHAGFPAISIARGGAQAFAEFVSKKTGKTYRLPTEAEWIVAARLAAGNGPLSPARRDGLAWHRGNSAARSHPVGTRAADALALFDLFGNAAEWVTTGDGAAVTRGGSFRDPAEKVGPDARAVPDDSWNERDPQLPKSRWWLSDGPFVGFRLARTP